MTQEEIISMAREAGFVFPETQEDSFTCWWEELERFAALVAEPWIETNKALAKELIELKKEVKQEPVGVVTKDSLDGVVKWNGWIPREGTKLYATPVEPVKQEPVVDYAYATIKEYEGLVGFSVSEAFRAGWNMARTTNSMFGINAAPVQPVKQEPVMDYERFTALREGERNGSERDYFNARPHNDTPTLRGMFCQGFDRGFDKGLKYAAPVEPVKQEPVAWKRKSDGSLFSFEVCEGLTPLYAAPVQPVKQEPVACPNLEPVIHWLANGCDPKEAAKELRIYQNQMNVTPVDTKAIRAEALEEAAQWFEGNEDDVGYAIATEIRGLK